MKAFRRLCIAVTAIFILLAVILNFFIIRYLQTDSGLYRVEAKRLADELEDTGTYDLSAYPHLAGVFHASDGELFKTDEHYLIIEARGELCRVEYSTGNSKEILIAVDCALAAVLLLICGIIASGILKHQPGSGTKEGTAAPVDSEPAASARPETAKEPVPEVPAEPVPENPLEERIFAVRRQMEEKGIPPADPVYHIPLSLEALPALTELDAFLSESCGTWPPAAEGLDPVPIGGKRIAAWQNETGLLRLEIYYSPETGEMISWMMVLLLEDRANGTNVNRELAGEDCWRIRWNPPLRTAVTAEYSPDGALSVLRRGDRAYSAAEELPVLKGVEYLP